jgi:hypothetical protein
MTRVERRSNRSRVGVTVDEMWLEIYPEHSSERQSVKAAHVCRGLGQ